MNAPTIYAHQLEPGMTVLVNGSEVVTVAEVTRRDSEWISNGVVYFTATNGRKYGFKRLDKVRSASEEATR